MVIPGNLLLGLFLILVLMLVGSVARYQQGRELEVLSPVYQGPEESQLVSLTFNVDWGSEYLPGLLELLDQHQTEVTFFLTGGWMEKNPELLHSLFEAGHQLENHGYRHLHPNSLTEEEVCQLIEKNSQLLEEELGVESSYFAPPYGEYNDQVLRVADELDHTLIMWTVDSIDWQRPEPEIIQQRVLEGIEGGAIVLLHPTAPTLEAMEGLIISIKERGYRLVTLSEMLTGSPGGGD